MKSAKHIAKFLVPFRWRRKIHEQFVSMRVHHLNGLKRIRLAPNEAIVTCVVRNGEFYIEQFIKHYTEMGFRHIFFLDNGSSDQTLTIARKYSNVSVCQSTLPIDAYQLFLKRYLARHSSEGGWCLDADIDEFFDYPMSDVMGLSAFLDYLNQNGYQAVMTQLLDMFPEKLLSDLVEEGGEDIKNTYQYYDLSEIRKTIYGWEEISARYGNANRLANPGAELCWGGIRKALYGNDCLLTKHSLFSVAKGIEPFTHVHFVNNARLADLSCVMRHYKLTSSALSATLQNKERFSTNSKPYGDFIDFLTSKPNYQFKKETAVKWRNANELVDHGFLFSSGAYYDFVAARTEDQVSRSAIQ
jgi:glycosyltransferase involved in cell wall biosynthesis